MLQIRASQVFTHSIDDAVAAKKALDADEPFNDVVQKYSTCPSKQQGGDLGWMPEEAALSLMGEKITKVGGLTINYDFMGEKVTGTRGRVRN